jgi:hypothetical protein
MTKDVTPLYMEQWKRSASYILSALPLLVLSDVELSLCPGFSLRKNDELFYWVIFMEIDIRTVIKEAVAHCVPVKVSDDWAYFHMWEDYITRYALIAHYLSQK